MLSWRVANGRGRDEGNMEKLNK